MTRNEEALTRAQAAERRAFKALGKRYRTCPECAYGTRVYCGECVKLYDKWATAKRLMIELRSKVSS